MAAARKSNRIEPIQPRTVSRAALRAATSVLLGRAQFASDAGLSFQDSTGTFKRDVNAALGYKAKLTTADYRARYERGGIAERIVEAYPRATWGGGADIQEDPDPDTSTPFEEAVRSLFKRLNLWARLLRADILAGLGEYSVLLIGAPGPLNTELPRLGGVDDVLYLTPLAEDHAKISALVNDTNDERYGLPLTYDLRLSTISSGTRSVTVTKSAHWSRIIHIAEGTLENDVLGKPRLRAVWNYLDDLVKNVGGGSEAAWKRMDPGLQVDLDPEGEISDEEEGSLSDEIDEYVHGLRRVIRTRGGKVNILAASVTGFGPNVDTVLQLVSATTGIPHRILTGSERGELASTQDRNNWNDRVAERRREFAVPVVGDLINRLILAGALPAVESFDIVWPDSKELDENERAAVVARYAEANSKQRASGDSVLITSNEMRDRILDMDPLDPDQLLDMDSAEDSGPLPTSLRRAQGELRAATAETRAVQKAADRHRMRVVRLFILFWVAVGSAVNASEFNQAVDAGDRNAIEQLLLDAHQETIPGLEEALPKYVLDVLSAGAEAALRVTRQRGTFLRSSVNRPPTNHRGAATVRLSFDKTNPRALAYARTRSSYLIKEVSKETIKGIRFMVGQAFELGLPPVKLRQLIKQSVGLRSDQIAALHNFGTQEGVTPAQIAKYQKKLLNDRAILIARTETMRSANAGQQELWMQAKDEKLIDPDQKRVWIDSGDDDVRVEHHLMNGQIRGLDEPFSKPDGKQIEPGEEPNCRCGQGLATEEDLKNAR